MKPFCDDVDNWLKKNDQNVAVIHCDDGLVSSVMLASISSKTSIFGLSIRFCMCTTKIDIFVYCNTESWGWAVYFCSTG